MNGFYVTVYTNVVALMLSLGLIALAAKLKMKDEIEKRLYIFLISSTAASAFLIILGANMEYGILAWGKYGALILETILEMILTFLALIWFVYVDYRIFRSPDHLKRNMKFINIPVALVFILNLINLFTGIMFYYEDDLTYHETSLYIVCDIARLIYFMGSLVYLEWQKRKDKRLRYLSVKSFIIPMVFFVLLIYFTSYATSPLGLAIGLALMYVQDINYMCYQDGETGFYNRLYMENLKKDVEKGVYDANGALVFELGDGDRTLMAELITEQLPMESDTIRLGKDRIVTLAAVKDRSALKMLGDDVEMSFEEKGLSVSVNSITRKKKESPVEFLDRIMENDR